MVITASKTYWVVVALLLVISVFFFVRVERYKAGLKKGSGSNCLALNDAPVVQRVIDGDEILVQKDKCLAVIRLLGIRAFDPDRSEPPLRPYATLAVTRLKRLVGQKVTVLGPKELTLDSRGRTLARVGADGRDIGKSLVEEGLVLVYRKYAFDEMKDYLAVELRAKSESKGLWADAVATARAQALQAAYERERTK